MTSREISYFSYLKNSNLVLAWPYVLHVAFIFISYFYSIEHLPRHTEYSGFLPYALLSIIYLICFYLLPVKSLSKKHIIIMGLLYIGSPPLFENDQFRYIWEGKVIAQGENPYKHAPNSEQLKHIEFEKKNLIAYNRLTSIYPPLAQVVFLISAPFPYKVGLIILQFLCLFLLMVFLDKTSIIESPYLVLILPFLFKEFVQSVHIDIVAVTILVLLKFLNKESIGIFLAYLVKFLSFICLPFLVIQKFSKSHYRLSAQITFIGFMFLVITYFSYPSNQEQISGAKAFVTVWQWNSFTATSLSYLFGESLNLRYFLPFLFILSYVILLCHYILKKSYYTEVYYSTAYLLMLFFSPVFHPWYAIWALAFSKGNKAVYLLCFSTFLAYSSYGASSFNTFAESIQWLLIVLSIAFNITSIRSRELK